MYHIKAHTLRFQLPSAWHEVTLAQALRILTEELTDREIICLLSGLDESAFRELPIPDLVEQLIPSLRFLTDIPEFDLLPIPKTVTLPDGRIIDVPGDVDLLTTGQRWDLTDELVNLETEEKPVNFITGALPLLGVCLASAITRKRYKDISQAEGLYPLLNDLPSTVALSLAAFFLRIWTAPPSTGKIRFRQVTTPTPKPLRRLPRIWNRTLRFMRLRA
ncbi:hypothetical protein GCM10028803_00470 [Larkinella knui]|uniref:Uncharacterized protein n=1 Tax=Larkinella knui TaxID=2025310 RepID=A0A3P1CJB8_9BACT|nr:hypothetical protein [Larkinella knui]RRB13451.1 hypothetical protein EHT87_14335 [Larkinella knui]